MFLQEILERVRSNTKSRGPVNYRTTRVRFRKKSPFHKNKAFRLRCTICNVPIPWYRDTLLCDEHNKGKHTA